MSGYQVETDGASPTTDPGVEHDGRLSTKNPRAEARRLIVAAANELPAGRPIWLVKASTTQDRSGSH
jgi:hypothetical protein